MKEHEKAIMASLRSGLDKLGLQVLEQEHTLKDLRLELNAVEQYIKNANIT